MNTQNADRREGFAFPKIDQSLAHEAATTSATLDLKTGTSGAKVNTNPGELTTLGETGNVVGVHKRDAEGLLMIDAFTGKVISGQQDAPEWAEGLVLAMLSERHIFYSSRLGAEGYTADHRAPEVLAYEDLEWMALSPETGDEVVIQADDEFRMEVLAGALGVDRETGKVEGAITELLIARDDTRTGAEMQAFTDAQDQGAEAAQKTGTND